MFLNGLRNCQALPPTPQNHKDFGAETSFEKYCSRSALRLCGICTYLLLKSAFLIVTSFYLRFRCTKQQKKIMCPRNKSVNQPTPLYRVFQKLVIPYLLKKIPTFKRILKKHYQLHNSPPLSPSRASLTRSTPRVM